MTIDSLAANTSHALSTLRIAPSPRRLRSLFGLGLLAAAGGLVPGCGAEATEAESTTLDEPVGEAAQALTPTCITLVRGGAGNVFDTRLREDTPTTAYGSTPTVVTGNEITNRVTLLRFDLSPIPAGAVITSADVTLHEVLNQGPSTVSVHPVSAPWDEATVTWSSFSNEYSGAITSFSNGGFGYEGPISFSITSRVQSWLSGSSNFGLALLAPTNSTWSSSEATTAVERPSLAVCYTVHPRAGAIATGGFHSLARGVDGSVWATGWNTSRQLGDGTAINRSTPVEISGLSNIAAVAAKTYHSLALKSDGTVWAMGLNHYGELGDGTTTDRSTPVQAGSLSNVTAVAAGMFHSLALKADGSVWATGQNTYGQLGDGTTTDRSTAAPISGLSEIIAVSAGTRFSLALRADGSVWATGQNTYGQLGDGTTTDRSTPVRVSGLSDVKAISAGETHSLLLKSDGTVWTMGQNAYGQLGDGTTTNRSTPQQISGLAGITAVSAGVLHSLALKWDGTVWAVGANFAGQLGDGTTTERHTPVQINGLSRITAVAAGAYHSLALKSDGRVWAFGDNAVGSLGDGTLAERHMPVLSLLP